MTILIFMIFLWYSGLFFQTFFLHRYAAHQTFTMSPLLEKICFIFTWLTQGSNYLSAYGYGIMHRMHHAYTDTKEDPHSPKFDKNPLAMMWRTKNIYQDINKKRIIIAEKFTKNVPQWEVFDNFASSIFRCSSICSGSTMSRTAKTQSRNICACCKSVVRAFVCSTCQAFFA